MADAPGRSIAQVAKELGIYDSTLGNWVTSPPSRPPARQRFKGAGGDP
jgi:hypothetical protein